MLNAVVEMHANSNVLSALCKLDLSYGAMQLA